MKRKLVLTLGFAGVLALSVCFAENLQSTKVSAEEQPKLAEQTDTTTVITKEEQNRVEKMLKNMPTGFKVFVPQENGTGFYVSKAK
ncbi:hypothetical protein [Bacillus sp. ISL-7]|uniref:hypothetical protein n=1 Tax=Bacillus sp. ISL-7 TaxID=2819136 RepID=UPI001BE97BD5|nr:hypothetical protein [Bacillus sp. ISL-7]MBT2733466.1 hypothetical protein [Bacillus sp. ISL-7]